MPATAIVGLQWGDEGKGKIAHLLSRHADLVVRSQGGANAGHTVKVNGTEYKWSVLPAGAMSARAVAIAPAVVVDANLLIRELDALSSCNPEAKVYISSQCHLVLDVHKEMDAWEESLRGRDAIGTTKMGIGPTYEDKCARRGLRIADTFDESLMRERISELMKVKRTLGLKNTDVEGTLASVKAAVQRVSQNVCHVPRLIHTTLRDGGRVILEGAHGSLLDLDFGTYPFVTSSNTIASGLCMGAGIGPRFVDRVVGITKAYTTRVGAGPFPTEMDDSGATELREKAKEYGTRTGRPRRVGWLDLFATKYAHDLNGTTEVVITKIDMLGGIRNIKVCTGYELDGEEVDWLPQTAKALQRCRPIYEEFKGWPDQTKDKWRDLARKGDGEVPGEIQEYVHFAERFLRSKASMLSVGPEVEETIHL